MIRRSHQPSGAHQVSASKLVIKPSGPARADAALVTPRGGEPHGSGRPCPADQASPGVVPSSPVERPHEQAGQVGERERSARARCSHLVAPPPPSSAVSPKITTPGRETCRPRNCRHAPDSCRLGLTPSQAAASRDNARRPPTSTLLRFFALEIGPAFLDRLISTTRVDAFTVSGNRSIPRKVTRFSDPVFAVAFSACISRSHCWCPMRDSARQRAGHCRLPARP